MAMRITLRTDSRSDTHTHCTLFMNGASCGHLCMRNEEYHYIGRMIVSHDALIEACEDILNIIHNSRGLDGWHLNGDVAMWDEFEEPSVIENALNKATDEK